MLISIYPESSIKADEVEKGLTFSYLKSGGRWDGAPGFTCDLYISEPEIKPIEENYFVENIANWTVTLVASHLIGMGVAKKLASEAAGVITELVLDFGKKAIYDSLNKNNDFGLKVFYYDEIQYCRGYVNGVMVMETPYRKTHNVTAWVQFWGSEKEDELLAEFEAIGPGDAWVEWYTIGNVYQEEEFMTSCIGHYCNTYHKFEDHVYEYDCSSTCQICGFERFTSMGVSYSNHKFYRDLCTEDEHCIYCGAVGKGAEKEHLHMVEANCYRKAYCKDCSYVDEDSIEEHIKNNVVEYCEGHSICFGCGAEYPAVGHDWIDATCETPKTCARCLETEGLALGHKKNDPDCEKGVYCVQCGRVYVEASQHPGEREVYTCYPTCTEKGQKSIFCVKCNKKLRTYAVPAKGHTEGEWITVVSATCTREGRREINCTVCNETLRSESIKKKTHYYYRADECDATCTTDGYVTYRCSSCGDSYRVENEDAYGHSCSWYTKTSPTCTASGLMVYKCSRCGQITATETISSTGHLFSDATCTSPGKCLFCGAKGGSALGHSYNGSYVDYDRNSHAMSCDRCGNKKLASHIYRNGVCKICGHVKGREFIHSLK